MLESEYSLNSSCRDITDFDVPKMTSSLHPTLPSLFIEVIFCLAFYSQNQFLPLLKISQGANCFSNGLNNWIYSDPQWDWIERKTVENCPSCYNASCDKACKY